MNQQVNECMHVKFIVKDKINLHNLEGTEHQSEKDGHTFLKTTHKF